MTADLTQRAMAWREEWIAKPRGEDFRIEFQDEPYNPDVATVFDPSGEDPGRDYMDLGSHEARAHLMAAAPEMYRALERYVQASRGEVHSCYAQCLMCEATRALKKARGER